MLVYMNNQQSVEEQEKTDNTGQTDRRQECRQHKNRQIKNGQRYRQWDREADRQRYRETDLHLLHDEVGAKDGVPFLWVLSTMLLCPRGLSRRREANHHKHLEKRRSLHFLRGQRSQTINAHREQGR